MVERMEKPLESSHICFDSITEIFSTSDEHTICYYIVPGVYIHFQMTAPCQG